MSFAANYVQLRQLFFGVCIPVRVGLAFAYYVVNSETVECGEECIPAYLVLRWLAGVATAILVAHLVYFEAKGRERGFFGGIVWWHNMRRVHLFNYSAALVFLLANRYGSHYLIFADVALSFVYALVRKVFIFYV